MSDPRKQIKIFLIDDHPLILHALRQLLLRNSNFEICGDAGSLELAKDVLLDECPDVLIADLIIRDELSLAVIEWVRQNLLQTRLLIYSMTVDVETVERSMQMGAMGFLSKADPVDQIEAAVLSLHAGQNYLSETIKRRIIETRTNAQVPPSSASRFGSLTDREIEIFELTGKGLTSREIAETLSLSHKTVEAHRQNIRQKLEFKSMSELVRQAAIWKFQP